MNVIPNELQKEVQKEQKTKDITKAGEQPTPVLNQFKDSIKEIPKETPPPTPVQSPLPSKDAKSAAPATEFKEQATQNAEKPPSIPMPSEVKSAKYYHGIIPRVEAESALRCIGDYLLRKAEVKDGYHYIVLSVKKERGYVHIPLNHDKDAKLFWFDPTIKDGSVTEVIQLHMFVCYPLSPYHLLPDPVAWLSVHVGMCVSRSQSPVPPGSSAMKTSFCTRKSEPVPSERSFWLGWSIRRANTCWDAR